MRKKKVKQKTNDKQAVQSKTENLYI